MRRKYFLLLAVVFLVPFFCGCAGIGRNIDTALGIGPPLYQQMVVAAPALAPMEDGATVYEDYEQPELAYGQTMAVPPPVEVAFVYDSWSYRNVGGFVIIDFVKPGGMHHYVDWYHNGARVTPSYYANWRRLSESRIPRAKFEAHRMAHPNSHFGERPPVVGMGTHGNAPPGASGHTVLPPGHPANQMHGVPTSYQTQGARPGPNQRAVPGQVRQQRVQQPQKAGQRVQKKGPPPKQQAPKSVPAKKDPPKKDEKK